MVDGADARGKGVVFEGVFSTLTTRFFDPARKIQGLEISDKGRYRHMRTASLEPVDHSLGNVTSGANTCLIVNDIDLRG